MKIKNKVAVVTGASKGIGLAIAKDLLKNGWVVYGISRTKPKEKLDINFVKFDLYKLDKIKSLIKKLPRKISLLVNNAGFAYRTKIKNIEIEDFHKLLDLNFIAPVLLTKHLLPRIPKGGIVVNISSDVSCMGLSGYTIYSASKSGINRLSTTLAQERKDLISIGILPSMVDTPLLRSGRGSGFNYETVLKAQDISNIVLEIIEGKYKSGSLIVATNNKMLKWWKDRDKYLVLNVDKQKVTSSSG